MAIAGVNRYGDMVKAVVGGPFYDSRGTVIPYRKGPTDIRLKTDNPSTVYSLLINEVYEGTVTSDTQGNVVFSRQLSLGDNEIRLTNLTTGYALSSWLTVREYALWFAAWSEAIESIDDDWQEAKDDLFIETATVNGVEDHFGKSLGIFNVYGQDLDTYRYLLHEMRNAFRDCGGKFLGVESAVGAITQVPPFGYTRRFWGPNWVLDQSMLMNHRFLNRSCEMSFDAGGISGVTLIDAEPDAPEGVSSTAMQYDAATRRIRWGIMMGSPGPWIPVAAGDLFIPGPPSATNPYILGLAGPFTLSATKRYLYLNIGAGTTIVDLSTVPGYPIPTVAQLVTFINTAMGVVVASSYNSKLLLSYAVEWFRIEPGLNNAALELFGNRPGDLVFAESGVLDGVSFRRITGTIDISSNSVIEYLYDGTGAAVVQKLRWNSPGGAWPPGFGWVTLSGDGSYVLTDTLGYTLEVHCLIDDLTTYGALLNIDTVPFSVNYSRTAEHVQSTCGAYVYITESALPMVPAFDTITISGDASATDPEFPDGWSLGTWNAGATGLFEPSAVDTDRADVLGPCSAFRYHYTDAAASRVMLYAKVLQYPNPQPDKGCSYPQKNPGLLYDYEGFEAKFSGWFLSHSANVITVALCFTFDGGATWVNGTPTVVAADGGGLSLEEPTYLEFSAVIPAEVTADNVGVRIAASQGVPGMSFSVDCPRVDVQYITSRCLGTSTVARSRHRQFFGELLYVWASEALTTVEKEYLGVIHKAPSRNSPFAGATIASVSYDTSAGNGTFEYEYNSIGPSRRLRWSSSAGSWGIGLGWVVILSDGTYILASPDGSSVTVDVLVDILPLLSGTPPVAVSSKIVAISDITTDQGVVRRIAPAHSSLDIIDATKYDPSGVPLNLKGSLSESDFSLTTLLNLDIAPATPFKYSFLSPNVLPVVGETLTFSGAPPYVASLLYESDQDQDEAILFENGLSFPNDLWQFNTSNQIQIINPADYNPALTYTISYNPLFQVTTPLLDLGSAFQDYMWLADYMLWDRREHDPASHTAVVPLYFSKDTGQAKLHRRSDMVKTNAILYYEAAEGQIEILPSAWRFLDPFTVSIDASQYIDGAQYFLTHGEQRIYPKSSLTVLFEHRSGVDSPSCLADTWHTISRNENVTVHQPAGGHVIHQLRLSVSSIRTLKDFRIRSLVLKGLHLYGSAPSVVGLTNVQI